MSSMVVAGPGARTGVVVELRPRVQRVSVARAPRVEAPLRLTRRGRVVLSLLALLVVALVRSRAASDAPWLSPVDYPHLSRLLPSTVDDATVLAVSLTAAIGLGTLFGGWRIVKTMGQRITKLKPVGGFCAETGGAITLFLATSLGIPVSTTHTITGAIVGVGSVRRTAAVRWGIAGSIVWAWVLTIPCSALIAAAGYWLGRVVL